MTRLLLILLLGFASLVSTAAAEQPAIIFSQEVVAINADGSMLPQLRIDPQSMAGMQTRDFSLGRDRLLRIETNISNPEKRGLDDIVEVVRRCYDYIEATTGLRLDRGVLLYLIEFDDIPYAYNFSASYNDTTEWGEVRLALIKRDATLSGKDLSAQLTDLLYDTLPHELGHDLFDHIPQLLHDIDGQSSHHTRWFIEGVCEVLAKGFSQHEDPNLYRRFLGLRNVNTVLAEARMQSDMLIWAQNNGNGRVRESDLYGAAMLTMLTWTDTVTLKDLFEQLKSSPEPIQGADLVTLMQKATGHDLPELLVLAQAHGKRLNEQIVLARLEL